MVHKRAEFAQKVHGLRAKQFNKKRYQEKATMKKTIAMHEEKSSKHKNKDAVQTGAIPAFLMDREEVSRAKVLSNTVKQKRKEKAGKWNVPIPKVAPVTEAEMFKVIKTGKRQKKSWKRMITKATFVGEGFTRKPPKVSARIRDASMHGCFTLRTSEFEHSRPHYPRSMKDSSARVPCASRRPMSPTLS